MFGVQLGITIRNDVCVLRSILMVLVLVIFLLVSGRFRVVTTAANMSR
jgi:hypothetical protein